MDCPVSSPLRGATWHRVAGFALVIGSLLVVAPARAQDDDADRRALAKQLFLEANQLARDAIGAWDSN